MDCATVVVLDEDHTLGAALGYCLSRHPDVCFAGYAIPHPAEAKLNLRVQATEGCGKTALQCLDEAAGTLEEITTILEEKLDAALDRRVR